MGYINRKSIQSDIRKVSPKEEYIAKSPTDLLAYTLINDWNTCRDAIMRYIQVIDPGKNFPWALFLQKVMEAIGNLPKGKK